MPDKSKDLIFYSGDRGLGCDRYTIKDELGMLVREEVGSEATRWSQSLFDAAGNETLTPVPAGTTLRVLELKPKDRENPPVMFTEYTYNVFGDAGLSNKNYPFSWEASQ